MATGRAPTRADLADVSALSLRQLAEDEIRRERTERRVAQQVGMGFSESVARSGDIPAAYTDEHWFPSWDAPDRAWVATTVTMREAEDEQKWRRKRMGERR